MYTVMICDLNTLKSRTSSLRLIVHTIYWMICYTSFFSLLYGLMLGRYSDQKLSCVETSVCGQSLCL